MPTSATVSPGATAARSREHRLGAQVAEVDVVDDDLAARHGDVGRVLLLGDDRVRVEDLEDAFRGRARLLGDRDDVGDHPDRREQLREVASRTRGRCRG